MNKENAKDFLPLVQALADGKVIQNISADRSQWWDMEKIVFSMSPEDYRVKPEPRVWYANLYPDNSGSIHPEEENADLNMQVNARKNTRIRVREILD